MDAGTSYIALTTPAAGRTSMNTMSTAYAAHFHDIYIDGKENAKMTGDQMKMLMLTLPFLVRDLIAPEVIVHTSSYLVVSCLWLYVPVCICMY